MKEELKLDNQLCFRLYVASRNMTRLYQPLLDKYHLTYPQYIILLVLFENEVIDFKELSRKVDLKLGTLTPIVTKIEEIGYLLKAKNEIDARKINVTLTQKGRELRESIIDVPLKLGESLNLTIKEYRILVDELDHLIQKMKEV